MPQKNCCAECSKRKNHFSLEKVEFLIPERRRFPASQISRFLPSWFCNHAKKPCKDTLKNLAKVDSKTKTPAKAFSQWKHLSWSTFSQRLRNSAGFQLPNFCIRKKHWNRIFLYWVGKISVIVFSTHAWKTASSTKPPNSRWKHLAKTHSISTRMPK